MNKLVMFLIALSLGWYNPSMSIYKSQLQVLGSKKYYIITADRFSELQQAAKAYKVYIEGTHLSPHLTVTQRQVQLRAFAEQPAFLTGETGGNQPGAGGGRDGQTGYKQQIAERQRYKNNPYIITSQTLYSPTGETATVSVFSSRDGSTRNSRDNSASRMSGGTSKIIIR